ncbi:MAG: S1 family peptidase [Culicoidibacterales bacterium]
MLTADKLMHITAQIQVLNENTEVVSTGTGFFFNFTFDEETYTKVLVTNKHVVKGAKLGRLVFTEELNGQPNYGEKIQCNISEFEEAFTFHPDANIDLCIMPLEPVFKEIEEKFNKKCLFISLDESLIPTSSQLKSISALEDVVMIGYPNGLWDEQNNLPIIRTGTTALNPKFDYNGKEDIVLDIASFPGSSGSPICIYNNGTFLENGELKVGERLIFLGILYSGPISCIDGEIIVKTIPTRTDNVPRMNIMLNLGYAVKSKKLLEFKPLIQEMLNK